LIKKIIVPYDTQLPLLTIFPSILFKCILSGSARYPAHYPQSETMPSIVSRSIVFFYNLHSNFSPSIDPLSSLIELVNVSSFVSVEPIHLSKFKLPRLVFHSSIFFLHSLNPPYHTANLHNTPATAISDTIIPAMVPQLRGIKIKRCLFNLFFLPLFLPFNFNLINSRLFATHRFSPRIHESLSSYRLKQSSKV